MKCSKCQKEFEGMFCPGCGTPADGTHGASANSPYNYGQPAFGGPAPKKKKPFFLRWWFILLVIIAAFIIALSVSGGGEKIVWEDMVLGEQLPEPPENKGEIHKNTIEGLRIDLNGITNKQYADYVLDCKEMGFTIDAEAQSTSYSAYNTDGYLLSLDHYESSERMHIELEIPMELSDIVWPVSSSAKQIPLPKSTRGKIEIDRDDSLVVYVGDTSETDFEAYITACKEKGFEVDYEKGDDYYRAKNSKGWRISLSYEGFNIMRIDVDAPEEEVSSIVPSVSSEETKPVSSENKPAEDDKGGLSSDFKAAMDSYEEFMDDYVAFMKKYAANPNDISLISDYAEYMSDYADVVADFEKWENDNLNSAELNYYIEVQARVSKKLLEIAK